MMLCNPVIIQKQMTQSCKCGYRPTRRQAVGPTIRLVKLTVAATHMLNSISKPKPLVYLWLNRQDKPGYQTRGRIKALNQQIPAPKATPSLIISDSWHKEHCPIQPDPIQPNRINTAIGPNPPNPSNHRAGQPTDPQLTLPNRIDRAVP